jgi:hypothetical protein
MGKKERATMSEHLELGRGYACRADLVCVLCARTAGKVEGPSLRPMTPMSLHVQDPRHEASVRRLRCPYCLGRLWLQNREEFHVNRLPLDSEELRPRRGRPPKVRRAS